MSKIKLVVAAGAATIALSGLLPAPAPASTSGWMVGGAMLSGSTKLASGGAGVLTIHVAPASITCTSKSFGLTNGEIVSPAKLVLEGLKFSGCEATTPCKVEGEAIAMLPLLGSEITLDGTLAVRGVLKPEEKKPIASLIITGSMCAIQHEALLLGSLDFLAEAGQDEELAQLVLTASLPKQLKLGSTEVEMDVGFKLRLEAGGKWSFL